MSPRFAWFMCRHELPLAPGGAPASPFLAAHLADTDPDHSVTRCGLADVVPVASKPVGGFVPACLKCLALSEIP